MKELIHLTISTDICYLPQLATEVAIFVVMKSDFFLNPHAILLLHQTINLTPPVHLTDGIRLQKVCD